jgi:hypothetical protein
LSAGNDASKNVSLSKSINPGMASRVKSSSNAPTQNYRKRIIGCRHAGCCNATFQKLLKALRNPKDTQR